MKYEHRLPADIEKTSMEIIAAELEARSVNIKEENRAVILRVIHTTADFDYSENLTFTPDAVKRGIRALKDAKTVITDTNMALSGISKPSLKKLSCEAVCFMAQPEIAQRAKECGTTRAAVSMEYASSLYPDGVFAVGNAPTALIKLAELIENGLRPSLIVGVPVGFVNVVESKEALFETCIKYDIPAIVAMGRKGGSNVAASICNALLYSACDSLDPVKRGWQ